MTPLASRMAGISAESDGKTCRIATTRLPEPGRAVAAKPRDDGRLDYAAAPQAPSKAVNCIQSAREELVREVA